MLQLLNETIHQPFRDVFGYTECTTAQFGLPHSECVKEPFTVIKAYFIYFTLFKWIVKDIGGYNNVNVVTLIIMTHYNVVINHMIVKHKDNFLYLVLY